MDNAIGLQDLAAVLGLSAPESDVLVRRICYDSRAAQDGDLFACFRGTTSDGHRHAAEAVANGASALLAARGGFERAGVAAPPGVPILVAENVRLAMALAACELYRHPSRELLVIGVTGTNGKTTTTHMVAHMLRAAGHRTGTIGTLGAEVDGERMPSDHTTPEAPDLQRLLRTMRDAGATAVVMEASSHALAQDRTAGTAFSGAVFTNITQDHLDYHATLEEYFAEKARLFEEYPVKYPRADGRPFIAAINTTQWEGRELTSLARGDIITFAVSDAPAVVTADHIVLDPARTRFTAHWDTRSGCGHEFTLPFGGSFQVANALGTIAMGIRLGLSPGTMAEALASMPPVPGRFEPVPVPGDTFAVVVDYAHTPDGLDNLIASARALHPRRIVTVFGCGGDRDRTKRPIMGGIAARGSEVVIVTSDNPRTEDPDAIVAEVLHGATGAAAESGADVRSCVDRRTAIGLAVQIAEPGDMVLIAGKGHEDYQLVGSAVLPFDDRLVAREALASLGEAAAGA